MTLSQKILIIDDDSRNIFALKAVLQARGYQCETAINAEDGLLILRQDRQIGIVLMDMMMPDMDGYEAIAQIKGNKKTASIPVIAITAQAMLGDKERCLAAGANAYISKPVDVDQLINYLNIYLP